MPITVVGVDQQAIKRATCRSCASILEYTPSDVVEWQNRGYDGSSDTEYYLPCPKCKNHVVLGSRY